ncbi:iron-containing redox enzyme family protein [Streptomyces venezuelae]|uniref:iron-containing redox enzyme family protein n=1 Tax=Streptomyces venezuelae TaxID=54571 RepID=UPI00278C798E|nr:iron-containing redox enzyme family protein [Streptomyces venezuelae]
MTVLVAPATAATRPPVPEARGDVSSAVRARLLGGGADVLPSAASIARGDPYGEDLQLALHLCYEPHYQGFEGVPDTVEWDAGLLGVRALVEHRFESALRHDCRVRPGVADALDELLVEPVGGTGPSAYLLAEGELWQLREHVVLRSVSQLRETDPQLWVIPRLRGRAKAAMTAIAYDEYGCGRAERVHAGLYADLMTDLGLDPAYGRYVDAVGAEMLAVSNLMSLLGLHRRLRGALVGHFAVLETTSPPAASRLSAALRRVGAGPAAQLYYDEHVEADAVHEQVVRRDVVGGLLDDEPDLAPDVSFGIAATRHLEDRLGDHLLGAWSRGHSALRTPSHDDGPPHRGRPEDDDRSGS